MYNVLVIIFVVLISVQSYDVFPKDVSIAHGNHANKPKMETAINQSIMKIGDLYPMEFYSLGYGKEDKRNMYERVICLVLKCLRNGTKDRVIDFLTLVKRSFDECQKCF